MSKTISQLPIASTVTSADVFPLDQGGLTKQATLSVIAAGLPAGTGTNGLVRETYPTFYSGFATNGINGISNNGAYSIVGGAGFGASGGGFVSLYGGTNATSPGLLQLGTNGNGIINVFPSGNVGIGTTSPSQRLSVNGNLDCSSVYCQYLGVINNFPQVQLTTTSNVGWRFHNTSNGASLGYCIIQGSTDGFATNFVNGFQIQANGACIIGPGSTEIRNIFSVALSSYAPAAIAANGGSQFLDVTLTGASSACACIVSPTSGPITSGVIVKAEVANTNLVRIIWVNTTTSSVTLPSSNYRIVAFAF